MQSRRFLNGLRSAKRRDSFTENQLQKYQSIRLKSLLESARQRVDFHHNRWKGLPSDLIAHFQDIPHTNKSEMLESFDQTIADGKITLQEIEQYQSDSLPVLRDKYLISKTSGTTGTPGIFVTDLDDWAEFRGAMFARIMRDRLTLKHVLPYLFRKFRMGFLVSEYPFAVSGQSAVSAKQTRQPYVRVEIFPIETPTEENISALNEFQPDYLHAFPSILEQIAHRKLNGEPVNFHPHVISMGSESTTASARETIMKAFPKAELRNQYGTTECVLLGNSCPAGKLHINSDYVIMEPMDEHGNPVGAGERSDHVLITNLLNHLQPIIRYKLEDCVRIIPEQCVCGRSSPMIEIEGRKSEYFHLKDHEGNIRKLPAFQLAIELYKLALPGPNQLVHVRQNEIELRIQIPQPCDTEALVNNSKKHFNRFLASENCDESTKIHVLIVDELERVGDGNKLQHVFSKVPTLEGVLNLN